MEGGIKTGRGIKIGSFPARRGSRCQNFTSFQFGRMNFGSFSRMLCHKIHVIVYKCTLKLLICR